MNKIYLLLTLFINVQWSLAQVVSIGTGSVTNNVPINAYYKYSYSQSIYLNSEMGGQSGEIKKITYKGVSGLTLENSTNWTIYMGHTSRDGFSSGSDWQSSSQMTQVFSGDVTATNGLVEITLTTPFNYNGTDNLVIAVDENSENYGNRSDKFYTTTVGAVYRSMIEYSDSDNPAPADPPSVPTTNIKNYVPNIDISFNASSCASPSGFNATNTTNNSVNLTWQNNAEINSWTVEYGAQGFSHGSGTTMNASTNSASVTGLSSNTAYQFYVKANCAAGAESAWIGPLDITTLCSAITAPYTQNFDASSNLDACWNTAIVNKSSSSEIRVYSGQRLSRPNSLYLNASHNERGTFYIATPKFSDLSSDKRVVFQLFKNVNNVTNFTLELGAVSNAGNWSDFVSIQNIDIAALTEYDWNEVTLDLSSYTGGAGHLVFKMNLTSFDNYNSKYLYFDDFVYETIPSCLKPTNLAVSNITGEVSADLSWTANSGETQWVVEYGTEGFAKGSGTVVTANQNPFTLSGIAQNSTYDFYVKANCSASGESQWSKKQSFSTSDQTVPMQPGVGINTEHPRTTLEVNGPIMSSNRNNEQVFYECNENNEGAMGYDKTDRKLKVCTYYNDKFVWKAVSYSY